MTHTYTVVGIYLLNDQSEGCRFADVVMASNPEDAAEIVLDARRAPEFRPDVRHVATLSGAYVRCPDKKRSEDDVQGCGVLIPVVRDEEGLVDCPSCGLFFNPEKAGASNEWSVDA